MAKRTKKATGFAVVFGEAVHPVTGQAAGEGYQWVRHALNGGVQGYVQEPIGTPYCCSASSESYFCS